MQIMAVSSTITQLNISNIVLEVAEATHKGPLSAKEKEDLQVIVNSILAILAVLGSIGSGDALADSMSLGEVAGGTSQASKAIGSATEDVADSALGRMMSRISEMLQELGGEKGIVYAENARRVLATAGAGFQGWEGGIMVKQGALDEALGEDQAAIDNVQYVENSNNSEQSDTQKQTDSTLKNQRMSDKNLDLFAGEKALARVLIQSPV
jgi:hypothetical protein